MKKLLTLVFILLIINGCYGLVVLVGDQDASVVRIPYTEGDCNDRAIDLKRVLARKGYDARVVVGVVFRDGVRSEHAWVKYRKHINGAWIELDPYDYKELYPAVY